MGKVEAKKEQIIQQIAHYLVVNGLTDTGLRSLATVTHTSDRMLIYYFETKDRLLETALQTIAHSLTHELDARLGSQPRSPAQLVQDLVHLAEVPDFNLVVRLWFELVGKAVRNQAPYTEIAKTIGQNWQAWIASRIDEPEQATAVFAEVEGWLMINLLGI